MNGSSKAPKALSLTASPSMSLSSNGRGDDEERENGAHHEPGQCPKPCCGNGSVCGRVGKLVCFYLSDWITAAVVTLLGWAIQPICGGPLFERDYYPKHTVLTGGGTSVTLVDPSLDKPLLESIFPTLMLGVVVRPQPCVVATLPSYRACRRSPVLAACLRADGVCVLFMVCAQGYFNPHRLRITAKHHPVEMQRQVQSFCGRRRRPSFCSGALDIICIHERLHWGAQGDGGTVSPGLVCASREQRHGCMYAVECCNVAPSTCFCFTCRYWNGFCAKLIEDGGLSYPSGHSSSAMCGLVPVTLHILGVSGALSGKGPRGMFWKLFLSCLPLALAAAVAISRTFVLCSVLLVLLHCGVTQNAWQNRAPRVATGHHTSHHLCAPCSS